MPRSKTGAGPGLNGALFTSHTLKIKNNPRPEQNLVLKIDWTGANFSTKFQVHDGLSVDLSPLFLWSSVLHVGYCFAYPCNLSVFPLSIQFFTAINETSKSKSKYLQ